MVKESIPCGHWEADDIVTEMGKPLEGWECGLTFLLLNFMYSLTKNLFNTQDITLNCVSVSTHSNL